MTFKKLHIIFFILLSSLATNTIFANSKLQWAKFLNDTTRIKYAPDYYIQGYTIDNSNNIYISFIANGAKPTFETIRKYTTNGKLIWEKLLVVDSLKDIYTSRFDENNKLFFNHDSLLVSVSSGYLHNPLNNSPTNSFTVLSKFDTNGNIQTQLFDTMQFFDYSSGISDIFITNNDNIVISQNPIPSGIVKEIITAYDKNFNTLYSKTVNPTDSLYNDIEWGSKVIAYDSTITTALITKNSSLSPHYKIKITKRSDYTGDTIWTNTIFISNTIPMIHNFEKIGNNIFLVCGNIYKIDYNSGQIVDDTLSMRSSITHFDKINNNFYCINNYYSGSGNVLSTGVSVIIKYDTNLIILDTLYTPYANYFISQKDSVIDILGLNNIYNEYYYDLILLKRVNLNLNCIDSFSRFFPSGFQGFFDHSGQNKLLLTDNDYNNIFLCDILSKTYRDSASILVYSAPLYLQKICYNCIENVKGKVYIDTTNSCVYDTPMLTVENNLIHLMPEDIYTSTDSDGNYFFIKGAGASTIYYINKFNNTSMCNNVDSFSVINSSAVIIYDSLNFGIKPKVKTKDAKITINGSIARPGFNYHLILNIENNSPLKLYNLTPVLQLDSFFNFNYANITPDTIIGNQISWTIDSINPGSRKIILLTCTASTIPFFGTDYKHTAFVTLTADNNLTNNYDTLLNSFQGAYDPNYKSANPEGITTNHYIENNTAINYFIEFQNTGNDTAFNIFIKDALDKNLDITTLKINASSHPMYYKIKNNELTFYFDNILLIDSNKDYNKSIGFVSYTITPKNCKDETRINNKANIYFDFNAPVETNNIFHTIGRPGSIFKDNSKNDFNFYPNPLDNSPIHIVVNIVKGDTYELEVLDILGHIVFNKRYSSSSTGKFYHTFDWNQNLKPGLYFIKLNSSTKSITKKLSIIN